MSSKDITLKPEVHELSCKLKGGMKLDKSTGLGEATSSLYEDNLPESLTPEILKEVSDYNTTFIAAGAHAFGELAVEAMSGNKKLERATIDIPMAGKDSIGYSVERHRSYPNHLGNGEPTEKFGIVTSNYQVQAGHNAGQLKKARLIIGELALEQLKG